jgi:NADH-quinone oxidoreductase subunit B
LIDIQEKIQKGGSLRGTALPAMLERERDLAVGSRSLSGPCTAGERGDEDRFGYRLPGGPARLGANESR